ncbi:response regulator [Cohnella endophytica]|uniref:Response regulator n=1 Tax=Cohnella endophytica TaxID=2419778 RepID=A0A494XTB8_9BACL|nr:response regulator [Cohnella endophytica]RKP53052.1 response regulator [Cohnella endophytica]
MRAIVIDDERPALESLARLLERNGVDVVGAFQDPREALKQGGLHKVDVAFVDIEMPELNGLELAARLQSAEADIHIVFVTAYEQYAIEAFELAAADYLLKPVQLARLDVTIKRIQTMKFARSDKKDDKYPGTLCLLHRLGFMDGHGKQLEITWRTTKAKELFAYLLHAGDRAPNKDELLDRIWPDGEIEKAATLLHTTLYHVRQTMKNADLPLRIDYKEGRYKLVLPQGAKVDARLWEQAISEAVDQEDAERQQRLLLDEYRGDYLEMEGFLWAENERERLRALWLEHALHFASWMEVSQISVAIPLYQRIQARFPEIEEGYFGLMRLYDKLGHTSEVRHQYAKLTRMLEEDFGMRPTRSVAAWFDEWNGRKYS